MTHIADVIGWKFDHQPGMVTRDGVITEFPGGIPSQADQDAWTAEYDALQPTRDWEAQMAETDKDMPRWMEDHITGDHNGVVDDPILQNRYNAKVALRGQKP